MGVFSWWSPMPTVFVWPLAGWGMLQALCQRRLHAGNLTGPLPLPQTPHPIPLPDPRIVGVSLQDCCEYQGPSCGLQCPESSWGSSLGVLRVAPQGPHMGCAPVKPSCPGLSLCPRHAAGSALLELGPGEGSLATAMLFAQARRSTAPGGFAAGRATSSSSTKGFWAQTVSL